MRTNTALTIERLRELLRYDDETGSFVWIVSTTQRIRPGAVAGTVDAGGYRVIKVDGTLYKAHRLAWLYKTGQWPPEFIDHINGDRLDNRLANLRLASKSINAQNTRQARKDNKSSRYLGVSFDKQSGRWSATIGLSGKSKKIGRYASETEAHAAYLEAKRALHPGCTI